MDQVNVLIIDDHPLISIGVESLLSKLNSQIECFNAQTGSEALKLLRKHRIELVFLDVFMPDTDTHNLLHQIKSANSDIRVLMFSSGNETIHAAHYINLGAHGFLQKGASEDTILTAVKTVLDGRFYITEHQGLQISNGSGSGPNVYQNPFHKLSAREMEVAKLLAEGKKVTEIANALNLHTSTIGTQKARILDKLSLTSQREFEDLARLHRFK